MAGSGVTGQRAACHRQQRPLLALTVVLGLLSACTDGPGFGPNRDIAFVVESSPASEAPLDVSRLVSVDDSLLALASTVDAPGSLILRSDDGGESWQQFATPLNDAFAGLAGFVDARYSGLVVAGRWLVAFQSISTQDPLLPVEYRQSVAISNDLGVTWHLIALPSPAGSTPFVRTATESDGRLILGGNIDNAWALPADPQAARDLRYQVYDGAVWASADPELGFERLDPAEFDGLPLRQDITELVNFDGRLIAIGGDTRYSQPQCCYYDTPAAVSWKSSDGGTSWAPMAGLPSGSAQGIVPAIVTEEQLIFRTGAGQMVLTRGSSTWTLRPVPDGFWIEGDEITLPDGSLALTWSENAACDCSHAFGGRLADGQLTRVELEFDDCEDDSSRGNTRVTAPVLMDRWVVAFAICGDDIWLASSGDGGASWETQPLPGYDGDITATGLTAFAFMPERGTLVGLLVDGPYLLGVADPRPLTAVRISVGG